MPRKWGTCKRNWRVLKRGRGGSGLWELLAAGTPGYVQGLSQVQPSEVRLGSQASHVLGNGPSLQQWVESGLTMAITARDMYDGRTKGTWAAASFLWLLSVLPKASSGACPTSHQRNPCLWRDGHPLPQSWNTKQIHCQWNRKLSHLLQGMGRETIAHFVNWLFFVFLPHWDEN